MYIENHARDRGHQVGYAVRSHVDDGQQDEAGIGEGDPSPGPRSLSLGHLSSCPACRLPSAGARARLPHSLMPRHAAVHLWTPLPGCMGLGATCSAALVPMGRLVSSTDAEKGGSLVVEDFEVAAKYGEWPGGRTPSRARGRPWPRNCSSAPACCPDKPSGV